MSKTSTQSCPRDTPWGHADQIKEVIPGMWKVSTPSQGGYYLTTERLLQMPVYMSNPEGRYAPKNWFEEDSEWCLPVLCFWAEYQQRDKEAWDTLTLRHVMDTFRDSYPERYELWTGEQLKDGESYERDEKNFAERTKDKWVAVSNVGDWHDKVPKGFMGSTCCLGGRQRGLLQQPQRYFLVPLEDERNFQVGKFSGTVIDETKHQEIEKL